MLARVILEEQPTPPPGLLRKIVEGGFAAFNHVLARA